MGVAPDALRDLLAHELVNFPGDVEAWLGRKGISVAWVASGAPGATVDQAGVRTDGLEALEGLML